MATPKSSAAAPALPGRLSRIVEMLRQQRLFGISVAIVMVSLVGTGAILMFAGDEKAVTVDLGGPLIYQPIPEIIADLKASARRSHHIKLVVVTQIPTQQVPQLTAKEVEIVASVQARLRELSVDDVSGAAGVDRVRALVLDAVNREIAPAQARSVLFTQILVD